jgi:hypothetical protein
MKLASQVPARSRAEAAWGADLPDWIGALAGACDATSQARVAATVGYSAAAISTVLRKCYPGDVGKVERAVRGALMNATVDCPVVGTLAHNECLAHQRAPFAATNVQRVALYRACRGGCPHSSIGRAPKGAASC